MVTIGTGIGNIFDTFKEGKLTSPVSWPGLYTAEGQYITNEMKEYYKHKKQQNKNKGGSECKK